MLWSDKEELNEAHTKKDNRFLEIKKGPKVV